MFVARSIAADHKDLIHDVSFDFHGRRMATCSSDQSVKVWDKSESGDWHCTASWKTHSGSVWRVTWAHPEFGQVLASCSFDRTAAVWEEIVGESNDKLRGQSHWVKRTTLVDSRTSVTDVKFAPKHMGLMLATCSADGIVRIYEAPDVMNLSQWSLQHEVSCKLSCSCISWNPSSSRAHPPMIAVGSDDGSPNAMAKVQIFEYNENTRKYAKAETLMTVTDPVHDIAFAPNLGRSFHILAIATKDVRIFTLKPVRKELTSSGGPTKFEIQVVAQFDNHNSQVWRVSWNITGTVLASSGDDGCVRLWKANYMDNWKCTGILKGNGSPVSGSSQQGNANPSLGSNTPNLQHSLNGSSASRCFFPPLDSPRAAWSRPSYAQLPPPPPLVEHSCAADTASLQYPHPRRPSLSRPLNPLPENEGVWTECRRFRGRGVSGELSTRNTVVHTRAVPSGWSTTSSFKSGRAPSSNQRARPFALSNPKPARCPRPSPRAANRRKPEGRAVRPNPAAAVGDGRTRTFDALGHRTPPPPRTLSLLGLCFPLRGLGGGAAATCADVRAGLPDSGEGCMMELRSEFWASPASKDSGREVVLMKTLRASNVYFHDTNASEGDVGLVDPVKLAAGSPHQNKHLASASETVLPVDGFLDTETRKVSIQKSVDVASLKSVSDNGFNSTDALWSPTSARHTCESYELVGNSKDQTDLPQSVVYQNEEGKWVTDLAYYTSFNKEQDLNVSLSKELSEDFRSGSDALDLIAHDEEEFNKEHQFMQGESVGVQNTSEALGDTSWGASANYSLLRRSLSTSDLDRDDASYRRLSLGEFFAQRSEALGCLGGGYNVKRPSFGYFIRSPEKREPVALIRKSDLSRSNLEKEMVHLNHSLFAGDLKAQLSEGSVTLEAEELENISQVDENDVTLTASKGKTEDTFASDSKPQRCRSELPRAGDSVLRISTIASAIADASVSADPSQLAAMIKALSNKTREKALHEDGKQELSPTVSHFLPHDLEKSNGSSMFDMEKYLQKTEISRCEGGPGELSRAGVSDIWDLSLSKEQTTRDIHAVDMGTASISVREPQGLAAAFYGENGASSNQASLRTVNSSNSVLTNMRGGAGVDVKTHSVEHKAPDAGDGGDTALAPALGSGGFASVRNARVASLWLSEECEVRQKSRGCQRQSEHASEMSNSEKHVTFENHSLISPKSIDVKNSPEHSGLGSEDDQDSFRPSTSPLSHSSPSEISGTSLSGCALESSGSAACPEVPPGERESSQLMCPQSSVSRLTYVSERDSSWPTTASDRGLEDRKSDITTELSTTIIQASPLPSQEPAVDRFREERPFQSRAKGALVYITQKSLDPEHVTETTSLNSRPERGKPRLRSSSELCSRSEDVSEASVLGVPSGPREEDQLSPALLSHPVLQPPAALRLPASRQAPVGAAGRVTPEDVPGGQGCHQMASAGGSAPETQPVAPTLTTQHPPPAPVPFAQPYPGTLPQSTMVCGCSGGCHPAITGEHIRSVAPMGICLGQSVGSGWMGAVSLCDLYPSAVSQSLLSTAKPFPAQAAATSCGIESWDSGAVTGLGTVSVPEELKFPHACCVGIASQTYLSVLNPTDRWLQVSVGVLSISVNGEKVDLSAYPCLVFKNKVIVRPHATEDIKVLFIPSDPGIFRCIFSVASWPFSADAETVVQAEALASRVVLTAIAETPMIEVETEKKDVLDFGDLTYGSWKALPLKLINRTHATIPVRLIINANAMAWRCFAFSKEPIHAALKVLPYADVVAQLTAPSVINHMMPASSDGQDPEFLIIWVLFRSPKKQITSSEILDSAEEFLARVDIEVDSPNPTPIIKSISLRARAGVARIHAPKDLQTMHLLATVASSTRQYLPLKNAGNIDVCLDIKIPGQGSHLSVDPEKLFLKPGEEHEVAVSFTPEDPGACEERILKIFVQPFGPQYEVLLKGEVISSGNQSLTPGSCCSDIPPILSNKQFLAWGGIPLGRTQLQKLALRNNSISTTQLLRLLIRGQDQDCFQLQHTFGSEERLTSNCEIRIRPKEDICISVLFAPTRLSCMLAKLEIKQLGIRSQPGVKFTIPLSGYGGTSNLILDNVKKLSDSYMVTVNDLVPGKESRIVFSVRNTGSRAAFVKAVAFKDSQKKILLDSKVLKIVPDTFVLKERTQEDVTIIYNPSDSESNYKTTQLSTIYFFGGDEISRQQFRRAVLQDPGLVRQALPAHSVLQNINFAMAFQDELQVTEVYDLPQRPNDIQLFYGNMRKIILSVIGEFRTSTPNRERRSPASRASSEPSSDPGSCGKHGGNVSLDVLPVKGPQGSPLLSQAIHPPQDRSVSEEVWAVQPEHLVLVAPSYDMGKTGRFQIINHSVRLLRFELYWPAHCLTVTPQHGFIAPESKLQILVSPNSSLSAKHAMFPWSGLIYIHCDNGQKKIVKVQIREDLTQEELFIRLTSSAPGVLSLGPEPSVSHLVKPLTKPPSTRVEIRNKTIIFPTTEPGETSGNHLELENHGDTQVRWYLSSLAPPYVKGVDESGDVFRATYAVFRCSPISGVLESHGVQTQAAGPNSPWSLCPTRRVSVSATRVGESRTLKVNLRNNSFITHSLKFLSPREPFYVKHSKYSLRAQHYINMPVQFKPRSTGRFEALLVVQTDEGKSVAVG
ncbi:centrosomal protein of 192 kDa [Phacochoerus africanus]|nr:centrosomal protein of 192 kDa [Phacochoerus africanus]